LEEINMAHWKEIGKKYNKLIKLLRNKGIIDEFESMTLFTEDYNLEKLEELKKNQKKDEENDE